MTSLIFTKIIKTLLTRIRHGIVIIIQFKFIIALIPFIKTKKKTNDWERKYTRSLLSAATVYAEKRNEILYFTPALNVNFVFFFDVRSLLSFIALLYRSLALIKL